jgi:predicted secreted protein
MGPVEVVITFILVWWCVFFAVLPMGVKGRWEADGDGVAGAEPGAPADPQLMRKAIITTGVAAALTAVVALIIASGVIDFGES